MNKNTGSKSFFVCLLCFLGDQIKSVKMIYKKDKNLSRSDGDTNFKPWSLHQSIICNGWYFEQEFTFEFQDIPLCPSGNSLTALDWTHFVNMFVLRCTDGYFMAQVRPELGPLETVAVWVLVFVYDRYIESHKEENRAFINPHPLLIELILLLFMFWAPEWQDVFNDPDRSRDLLTSL